MALHKPVFGREGGTQVYSAREDAHHAMDNVLEGRGQQRFSEEMRGKSLMDWTRLVPEPHGPLDFKRFPWQAEIYGPEATHDREQVYMKGTQVGISTQMIRMALYYADVQQRSVLYTFPTEDELKDFSQKRIGPVIRDSEHLRSRMASDNVDNVSVKQVGSNGWIFFRGTNKPIDSLDIDVAIFDEYDTSDLANITDSEYRVSGPNSLGLIRRVGVPSIPEYGISELYSKSDQRVWHVRCTACNERNPIYGEEAFTNNVDQKRMALVCRKCKEDIDVRRGEWVPLNPESTVRGYHLPKLLVPGRVTIERVVANSEKKKDFQVQAFYNRDLGIPFALAEGRLSREQVLACCRNDLHAVDPWTPSHGRGTPLRTMGVDVASVRALNVVIEEATGENSGRRLWAGEIEDDPIRGEAFTQLDKLMELHGINMAAIDNSPDGRHSAAFCRRWPGRAYRVGFFEPAPGGRTVPANWTIDDAEQFVSLWRSRAYEALFERFRSQQIELPPIEELPPDYVSHLGNLYRQKTEIEKKMPDGRKTGTGQLRVDFVKTGPEDYAQAEAYNLTAIELFWRNTGIEELAGQGPEPLIRDDDPEPEIFDADGELDFEGQGYSSGFEDDGPSLT